MPEFSIRLGYNYMSPMFSENGFRDGSLESPGSAYATSTDYTNWKVDQPRNGRLWLPDEEVLCGFGIPIQSD